VKLDAPIGNYASGLNPTIGKITSLQLLSHTAGLKDEAVMFGKHDDAELGVTVRALNQDSVFSEPGRVYQYANPGYWLAGYVIEQISGKSFADQLEQSLFVPLGMTRTTLRPTMAMTYPLSQGHEGTAKEKPHVIRPFADNAGNWPAGSMFSSVNDLSRFVIAFMNGGTIDGRPVLSGSLIERLASSQVEIPRSNSKYGLGLMIGEMYGERVIQHSGSRSGFGTLIRMFPERRTAIIMLINRNWRDAPKTAEKAAGMMLFASKK
jgi:CubicO group peptidase (beta-lactamase class C family)